MDAIKKMVEEIPYLQLPHESEEQKEEKYGHIETDEEIDGSLKINFKEMLAEDSDGQISLYVPKDPMVERQITGQMSIQEVLEEWEKTKRAAEAALQEAAPVRICKSQSTSGSRRDHGAFSRCNSSVECRSVAKRIIGTGVYAEYAGKRRKSSQIISECQ